MKRYGNYSFVFALLMVVLCRQAVATGLLIPTDKTLEPLAIKYHRATVKITDRAAVTHVDQVFVNHTGRQLEATYVFPLPRGATVSDFYLYVNGRRTKGEILEKHQARNIYEGIVRRMRDPGLLEYLDNDLFQCRVFPVPARGEQRIEIEFYSVLAYEGGVTRFIYPLRTDRTSARTIEDFTVSVEINSKTPIKSIYSPTHEIYQRKKGDHQAVAGFETSAAVLERDFELYYTVSDQQVGLNLLAFRGPGEPGFFMLMVSPSSELREKEIIGKRITFVIDTSGSMSGQAMEYAKKALAYCVERLGGEDLFNIVRFSTDIETFAKEPLSGTEENKKRALNFIKRMEAAGGTAIDEALQTALSSHREGKLANLMVFLTDGHPTVGESNPEEILRRFSASNRAGVRLFVFGVGNDLNTRLLDALAAQNGGDVTYVSPGKEIQEVLAAFYDKISHPVLTNLKLDFRQIPVFEMVPTRLPDLFKGGQLILFGRYRESGRGRIELTGDIGGERKKFIYDAELPEKSESYTFIPRLWAIRRVGYLLEQIRLVGENRELVDEVIRLAKRYGIVTPYTSYLVTEDTQQVAATPQPLIRPQVARDERARYAPAKIFATPPSSEAESSPSGKSVAYSVLGAESGERAVSVAQAVSRMKKTQALSDTQDEATGIRYAGDRAFRYQNGVWVDTRYEKNMQVLRIKPFSKAYFVLAERSALVKAAAALGERVIVVTSRNLAIEITPEGREEISEEELKKYLP